MAAQAHADTPRPGRQIDLQVGNWVAQHGIDNGRRPYCAALGISHEFAFAWRSMADGTDLRIVGRHWMLARKTVSDVSIGFGDRVFRLRGVALDESDTLHIPLSRRQLDVMLDAVPQADAIEVHTAVSDEIILIDLHDSPPVLARLKACDATYGLGGAAAPAAGPPLVLHTPSPAHF